ncbi:PilZ domain protein [Mariprofundus micogutta]|uniref:PilZ domain protein n=1 Tax=Mariprofundus micogutta TaxID=1921010 RepID=A0A1L8CNP9_9PROT|nr:PilZ domain-containing protein [Mariprofundus micogutta]GAV20527.1 PilZ domain protein [Mariprofundus micogutta]
MRDNQRKAERRPCNDILHGEVFRVSLHENHEVKSIRDVSHGGIGINVATLVAPGEKVRLTITREQADVQLYGLVAWCAPFEKIKGQFAVGLSLS